MRKRQPKQRQLFMPFAKVDKEKRIVWGTAQTEEVDTQDDLLLYEASVDAFNNWAGNIREQHDPNKAVGRAVEIVADDQARTITVGAHVSRGAEDTWQKVLDGTLSGFSIGGIIIDGEQTYDEDLQRNIRRVSEYQLAELSLVDVPANSSCVITAVEKSGKNLVATDVLTDSLGALTIGELFAVTKGSKMATKRAKVPTIVNFTKSLKADEEVVMIKKSDLAKLPNGAFTIAKNATVSELIRKEDLDADGYNTTDESTEDESPATIDFDKHAIEAAAMHKAFCKMGGIDDNEAHYMEATREDADEEQPAGEDNMSTAEKARRARGRRSVSKGAAANATPSKLEAKVDALNAKIDALSKSTENAPRVGSTAGTVVEKGGTGTLNKSRLGELEEKLAKARERQTEYVAKGSKPSDQERRERNALGEEISRLETEIRAIKAA